MSGAEATDVAVVVTAAFGERHDVVRNGRGRYPAFGSTVAAQRFGGKTTSALRDTGATSGAMIAVTLTEFERLRHKSAGASRPQHPVAKPDDGGPEQLAHGRAPEMQNPPRMNPGGSQLLRWSISEVESGLLVRQPLFFGHRSIRSGLPTRSVRSAGGPGHRSSGHALRRGRQHGRRAHRRW